MPCASGALDGRQLLFVSYKATVSFQLTRDNAQCQHCQGGERIDLWRAARCGTSDKNHRTPTTVGLRLDLPNVRTCATMTQSRRVVLPSQQDFDRPGSIPHLQAIDGVRQNARPRTVHVLYFGAPSSWSSSAFCFRTQILGPSWDAVRTVRRQSGRRRGILRVHRGRAI